MRLHSASLANSQELTAKSFLCQTKPNLGKPVKIGKLLGEKPCESGLTVNTGFFWAPFAVGSLCGLVVCLPGLPW